MMVVSSYWSLYTILIKRFGNMKGIGFKNPTVLGRPFSLLNTLVNKKYCLCTFHNRLTLKKPFESRSICHLFNIWARMANVNICLYDNIHMTQIWKLFFFLNIQMSLYWRNCIHVMGFSIHMNGVSCYMEIEDKPFSFLFDQLWLTAILWKMIT